MFRTVLFLLALLFISDSWADDVPDLAKTPGATRSGLMKEKICSIKWGRDERHESTPKH